LERRNYFLIKNGKLKRKDNTLLFQNETIKKVIPINKVDALYVYGELQLNKKLLVFLSQKNIPVHFFNYYGFYSGTFYPRDYIVSGKLLVNQVKYYLDNKKRLEIAKEIISSSIKNIIKNLEYYVKREKNVKKFLQKIKLFILELKNIKSIQSLMGLEGNVREIYYQSFNNFLRDPFKLTKRIKRPPNNMLNSLISFGNSLLYRTTLTEIYRTQLNPTISYLHEPFERRFSLSLDISEVFKPLIVDKVIFKLINNRLIKKYHFLKELNYCYLNDKGKNIFIKNYDEILRKTIKHPVLKRKVSLQHLIRLECYKLIKHLMNDKKYEGLVSWW